MAMHKIIVLPGDGIGKEITEEAIKVLRAVVEIYGGAVSFDFESLDSGAERFLKTGTAMTDEQYHRCEEADALLMGAIGLPEARHKDGREANGDVIFRLRFGLELYAGVRPVRSYTGVPLPLRNVGQGIDYVVVRENTEGLYASREGGCNVRDELVTDTLVVTREGTRRVAEHAFRLAARRKGRPRDGKSIVTCVDKANVLRSYAFFRKVFDETAKAYPKINIEHIYVDAMTTYQVLSPDRFDVVVAENMFGDIISDLSGATVGGLGLAPSGDIGDHHGLFQPAHGSAPDIAGKGVANPIAMILSAAMMLAWLSEREADKNLAEASTMIEAAVTTALSQPGRLTPDLGGTATTPMVGDSVVETMLARSR